MTASLPHHHGWGRMSDPLAPEPSRGMFGAGGARGRISAGMFSEWWNTVDRTLLAAVLALAFTGLVLSFAAGPPMAQRFHYDTYHFVIRHAVFLIPALSGMVLISMLPPDYIRRLAVGLLGLAFIGMVLTLLIGPEVNGAQRWLDLGPFSLQPSEFLKPALIVTTAWVFARQTRTPRYPGRTIAFAIYGLAVVLLVLEPDIGQTVLITAAWGLVFFVAGLPVLWVAVLSVLSGAALVSSYFLVGHVRERIDGFLDPDTTDTHQVDMAMEAIKGGGFFGRGPGEGIIKRQIPDAHTDFVFSVAAEEYGILMCVLIAGLFAFIVIRGLGRALREHDQFIQLAVTGLVAVLGLQAAINMGVNLHVLPAKGMTLPWISYGGSSLMATGLTCGMILALTRSRVSRRRLGGWSPG